MADINIQNLAFLLAFFILGCGFRASSSPSPSPSPSRSPFPSNNVQVAQLINNLAASPSFPCVMNCTVSYGPAWRSAMGYRAEELRPSLTLQDFLRRRANMTDADLLDEFERICSVYTGYDACLSRCQEDLVRQAVQSGFATVDILCGEEHDDYVETMPCLAGQLRTIQETCKVEAEKLALAAVQLHSFAIRNPENLLRVLREFCNATYEHAQCTFPALNLTCGETAARLMRKINERSVETSRRFLSAAGIQLPSECDALLPAPLPGYSTEPTARSSTASPVDGRAFQTQIPAPDLKEEDGLHRRKFLKEEPGVVDFLGSGTAPCGRPLYSERLPAIFLTLLILAKYFSSCI